MSFLDNRTVIVTGAGRGIGREIALLCAKEGANVVVNDPGVSGSGDGGETAPASQTVIDIRKLGGKAFANFASVADPVAAQTIVDDAVEQFGTVDAVVNNAGILRDGIWHKMSHEDWKAVIDVHLHGCFNVSKAATRYFKEQGRGRFVHFTSTSGLIGNVGQANYSAAKLGVVGLSQSIALDAARYGVTSNCIAPFAWSRMTASIPSSGEDAEQRVNRLKSMGAEKIAPLAAYLCSDASHEVNNQIFSVRRNEIALFSKPRPIRSMARESGWTVSAIAEELVPAMRSSMTCAGEVSADVFPYDPV